MKSLLIATIAALVTVLAIIAAGDYHGIDITVTKAIVSSYWLTIPMIVVGIVCAFVDNK